MDRRLAMTVLYNPVELERLVKVAKQLANADANRTGGDVLISRTLLDDLVDQLEASRREIDHITERDLFHHDCEWFIATDPEPWRIGRADFPKCEKRANCVGETLPRRSQYVLCREHAEQWSGDLVAMSGEAVAIPKKLRSALDAALSELEMARRLLGAAPAETLRQAVERVRRGIHAVDEQSASGKESRP